jgi:hypothetical protein
VFCAVFQEAPPKVVELTQYARPRSHARSKAAIGSPPRPPGWPKAFSFCVSAISDYAVDLAQAVLVAQVRERWFASTGLATW